MEERGNEIIEFSCSHLAVLLLACIQEIRKRFAILGSHTGPKEPCLSTFFMLVAVIYF